MQLFPPFVRRTSSVGRRLEECRGVLLERGPSVNSSWSERTRRHAFAAASDQRYHCRPCAMGTCSRAGLRYHAGMAVQRASPRLRPTCSVSALGWQRRRKMESRKLLALSGCGVLFCVTPGAALGNPAIRSSSRSRWGSYSHTGGPPIMGRRKPVPTLTGDSCPTPTTRHRALRVVADDFRRSRR